MQPTPLHRLPSVRLNPLVPAASLFLLGTALATSFPFATFSLLLTALLAWFLWLTAETFHANKIAHLFLALLLTTTGTLTYQLNQQHVEPTHIARFATAQESPITLRLIILSPPADDPSHGPRHFLARATALMTTNGWLPATGDLLVTAPTQSPLHRGDTFQAYAWLSRPPPALNPGARDDRHLLAADRIFAQLRVPRPSGLVPLNPPLSSTPASAADYLTRFRLYLRGKLLDHTLQQNVPAAYTLSALLLGHRDPAIADISQAFADAGIAHLLAISGMHIAFFTALAWLVLRLFPLRPRLREILIAAVILLYVLATPAGPPILRAAIILLCVLFAGLLARPRQYLNLIATAALIVIIIRPADITDAGFQLTFITTAALILLAPPLHAYLFEKYIARLSLIADLANTRAARIKLNIARTLSALVTANLIGATIATPLVAFHFGQINLLAPLTGLLALPVVYLAMVAAALQLLAELFVPLLAALISPLTTATGQLLITIVHALAALPGAAIPLRQPPIWAILLFYATILLWLLRPRLKISKAIALNLTLASTILITLSYTLTTPLHHLRLTAFDAGQSSALLLETPSGDLWSLNAGAAQGQSLLPAALAPAMRLAGSRHLTATLFTALDVAHAKNAAELVANYRPTSIYVAQPALQTATETLAGSTLLTAATQRHLSPRGLTQTQSLHLPDNLALDILWPPPAPANTLNHPNLILLLNYANQQILLADPTAIRPLAKILLDHPTLHADLVLLTGPTRGESDAPLLRILEPLHPQKIIWSGRTAWSPKSPTIPTTQNPAALNTADGAITLDLSTTGLSIQQINK